MSLRAASDIHSAGKEKNLHLHSGHMDGTISGQNLVFTYGMRRCSICSRQPASFRTSMLRGNGAAKYQRKHAAPFDQKQRPDKTAAAYEPRRHVRENVRKRF